jgi:hypothetical protein
LQCPPANLVRLERILCCACEMSQSDERNQFMMAKTDGLIKNCINRYIIDNGYRTMCVLRFHVDVVTTLYLAAAEKLKVSFSVSHHQVNNFFVVFDTLHHDCMRQSLAVGLGSLSSILNWTTSNFHAGLIKKLSADCASVLYRRVPEMYLLTKVILVCRFITQNFFKQRVD